MGLLGRDFSISSRVSLIASRSSATCVASSVVPPEIACPPRVRRANLFAGQLGPKESRQCGSGWSIVSCRQTSSKNGSVSSPRRSLALSGRTRSDARRRIRAMDQDFDASVEMELQSAMTSHLGGAHVTREWRATSYSISGHQAGAQAVSRIEGVMRAHRRCWRVTRQVLRGAIF
jgi:hypothetical protein